MSCLGVSSLCHTHSAGESPSAEGDSPAPAGRLSADTVQLLPAFFQKKRSPYKERDPRLPLGVRAVGGCAGITHTHTSSQLNVLTLSWVTGI